MFHCFAASYNCTAAELLVLAWEAEECKHIWQGLGPHKYLQQWNYDIISCSLQVFWILITNSDDVKVELQQVKDELKRMKQEMREEHITTRNTSLKGRYTAFHNCSGGFRGGKGCKCTPLWRLVMYFCVHNCTSPSYDYAAVACSNNQAQLHTHVSVASRYSVQIF